MAPPASDLLDRAESYLRVGSAEEMADAVTRSHLPDFRCVGWYAVPPPGWSVAIDAEYAGRQIPQPLARRFGTEAFWERWTRAECLCKLADTPMLAWWPQHGLDVPDDFPGAWRTLRLDDLVVSVALSPTTAGRTLRPA
ncbi:hypothetical protein Kfla_0521 [Kribbella flavida DSM 17836]|uniref:Uncharacterized protein n=1 Tax=Kribbella flavida (strain DSM 17836 / JCM 10339 / NBRC 14399) TaxID=479435 RepID=D2PVY6_KRIFD|nr:hypothetical protein [Kribbella flavida]ADB29643.1 hypothetical protein Kfla_0521 [Kribbella flavida DSM 17836]